MNQEGKKYQTRRNTKSKKIHNNKEKYNNKKLNDNSNIINSSSITELMKNFFKRDNLLDWQCSLISQIKEKAKSISKSKINRRQAYNDMMSYRNYHSNNGSKMSNQDIITKIAIKK